MSRQAKWEYLIPDEKPAKCQRPRAATYGKTCLRILRAVWEAAGYPWSVRLKALLPL